MAAVLGVALLSAHLHDQCLLRFRTVVEVDAARIAFPRFVGQNPFSWLLILPIDHFIELDDDPARADDTC